MTTKQKLSLDNPLHPSNPAQVRRRDMTYAIFGVNLLGLLATGGACVYSLFAEGRIPDGAVSLLSTFGAGAMGAVAVYVTQGVMRNKES